MTKDNNLPTFSIKQMLDAGVHFGHKTMRRNPKMSKYIFGSKDRLNIINLEETAICLHRALRVVKDIAKNNGRILFVATKKQAFAAVEEAAKRCGQYYVNNRWLGGMLTNWKTISASIKTLEKIEKQLANDELGLNKKERLVLDRQRIKLEDALGGIKNMGGYPDLIFIIDINREHLAVAEAKKLNLPIMAILDTNVNPDGITFPIPGNDDSVKSIKFYCRLLSDAAIAGTKESMAAAGINTEKLAEKTEAKKATPKKPAAKGSKTEAKTSEAKPVAKKTEAKKAAPKKPAAKNPAAKAEPKKAPKDKK